MRHIIAGLFLLGIVMAVVECDYPLFPWVQLAGVGLMGTSAGLANLIHWG